MDVAAWLRRLGLEQYVPAFRDNDIDGDVLPELTADDLISIGVTSVGHRRRLFAAIGSLRAAPRAVPAPADAERRQLTVMFCDLVGSTALSARLDPEDLRDVIATYHHAVAQVVGGYDGFVAKYMGDGVLVYFGYPRAHEDDAERAVRAGLGVIDAVARLDVGYGKLQSRVGIATGLVVVGELIGEGMAQEQSVVGETPNLAARLQTLAEPDTMVIATGTRRLVSDLFEYRDLGMIEVKGIAAPVPAWQVLGPSVVASRFEALRGSALAPLVGRDEEIELLLRRWTRAKQGDGQIVLISGEPGIGKSRITAALDERLDAEPHLRLRYFCSPYHQDSALYPVIDQIGRASGFGRDDPPTTRLDKLEALLTRDAPPVDVALLADLLSLPASQRYPLPNLSPQRKKQRILEALSRQLEHRAGQQPVVLVFEDAHWVDPTSLELLDLVVERVPALPVLLIITFRPQFQPHWTGLAQVTMLALNRLERRDRVALVAQISNKPLPDEVVDQIVDRSDGVPLFVEELTKSVLESDLLRDSNNRYVLDRALSASAIPTSLHDSLMARLDRLAPVRRVAQIGAAIGREFSYELLAAVARLSEDDLRAALGPLVASELVVQRGTPPNAVYFFKHALVQDAAHNSLLRGPRQQLHGRIAGALEIQSPELMESRPELFARHYAEAGLSEKSAAYWGKAGRRSAARSAMAEAAAQFQKGLEQLALLPDTPQRQRQELEFYSAMGAVLQAVRGFAAPEIGHAYDRARELWDQLGSPPEFLRIPYGQSRHHAFRGEFEVAHRLDDDLLRLSRQRNDSAGLLLGHISYGRNLHAAGQFTAARSHLEAGLALYDPTSHRSLVHQVGIGPGVSLRGFFGHVLLCLGFLDEALVQTRAAIAEARTLAHPPSLAASLMFSGLCDAFLGDFSALAELADETIAIAVELGFPHWLAQGTIYRGLAKFKNGDVTEGMSILRGGLDAYRATGAEQWMPFFLIHMAGACGIMGQVEEALGLFDEATQIVDRTGERAFVAELIRQKGELLLRQGHIEDAAGAYRTALLMAREQEAKFWELRAAASLARLGRDQGNGAEARDLLLPVYGWFTEGLDTPDLKAAKQLLDELGSGVPATFTDRR